MTTSTQRAKSYAPKWFSVAFAFSWAAALLREAGKVPSQHIGALFGLFLAFTAGVLLLDYALWRVFKLTNELRSGLWAAAIFGPWLSVMVELLWPNHLVWAHISGSAGAIVIFAIFYSPQQWWPRKRE